MFYLSDRGRLNEDPIVEFMSFKVICYLAFIASTKNNTSECTDVFNRKTINQVRTFIDVCKYFDLQIKP